MSSCDSKKKILIHVQTHQHFKHFLTLSGSGVAISDVKICRTTVYNPFTFATLQHVNDNVKCIFIAHFHDSNCTKCFTSQIQTRNMVQFCII